MELRLPSAMTGFGSAVPSLTNVARSWSDGVASPDWRRGLPVLTPHGVTLRDLPATHPAAAGDGGGVRTVHRVDPPAARSGPLHLLRRNAYRRRHGDRHLPAA